MFLSKFNLSKITLLLVVLFTVSIFINSSIHAVPMSPELVEKLRESGELQKFIDRMAAAKAKGVCQPHDVHLKETFSFSTDANAVDTFRVVVILADFSDKTAASGGYSATVADFEHLLFSFDSTDTHYSMSEFYYDNSYGNFVLEGVVAGWYRLPQTYAYYVDGNNGFGSYPTNAQRMAEDAITAANPFVDYSQFDNDGNGTADGVFIVHAGPGAEATGSDFDIWSHAWGTSYTMNLDGISISRYTTEPEEGSGGLITQGVFSHEYGHFLGLPDLYDTDYSSSGIGKWSLMAGGSWNSGGRYPAFFDAWCKKELGFINLTNVTSNLTNQEIPSSYHNPVAYRIWENGVVGQEYFIVENRQQTENDFGIPGSGLLIYHIDETQWGNSNEPRYLVGIEQADGKSDLENDANSGDAGDIWSTATQTEFTNISLPNTNKYSGAPTDVLVWDISASDSLMYANLDISYSAPRFSVAASEFSDVLYGNNNSVVDLGETITFTFTVNNLWLTADNVTATMYSGNPDFVFTTPTVNIGTVLGNGGSGDNTVIPIVFDIPPTFDPCIDSFFLDITSDNPLGAITFGYELHVGTPEVLIVDDDNGAAWDLHLVNTLRNLRIPHDVYDKSLLGSPSSFDLDNYDIVIWNSGDDRADVLSTADVTAMKGFMDNGGRMMLAGQSLAEELSIDDLSFLQNYFKADYVSDLLFPLINGSSGSVIGDGLIMRYDSWTNQTAPETMALFGGDGNAEFELQVGGLLGISYDGTYKSLLMSFGFEGISNNYESQNYATQDTVLARIMTFFDYGAVNQLTNPYVDSIIFPSELSASSVSSATPIFGWSFSDTTGATQIQYQVQVGTGNLCFNANDMWESGILTGSIDSIEYAGAFLDEGASYFVRMRVYNGTDWSGWRRTIFRMNATPLFGSLVSPISNIQVNTNTPSLVVNNGSDGNGDVLTYEYEVYDDFGLSSLVTSASLVAEGVSTTSWTVDVPLTEDAQFYWRSRVNDGAVSSDYSAVESFVVNAVNQAPTAFGLQLPADSAESVGTTPTFTWDVSTDADPGDSVLYTLMYDDDALFSSATTITNLNNNSFTISSPLTDNVAYFWKIIAVDVANDSTISSETFVFKTDAWNTAPVVNVYFAPYDYTQTYVNPPFLIAFKGSDINGDVLTHDFEIYNDSLLTSLVSSVSSYPEGPTITTWMVDVNLVENNQYYWRSRVYDGSLYSEYSLTHTFYLNAINQAPEAFSLIAPADSSAFVGVTPHFDWEKTFDNDLGDSAFYTLMFDEDSLFGSPIYRLVLADTAFTLVNSLNADMIYYWKVLALDLVGDSAWSSEQFVFNTGSWGCCVGFRGNVDGDGLDSIDIADLVYMVAYMFQGGPAPICLDEADIDASGGEPAIDIADLVYLVAFMFQGGANPPNCP